MTPVEQYLSSPQAVEDLREHLERSRSDHKLTENGWCGRDDAGQFQSRTDGAWHVVRYTGISRTYFRWDRAYRCGDLTCGGPFCDSIGHRAPYIVSDLGEGLRCYALRTGDVEYRSLPGTPPSSGILERDGRLFACYTRRDSLCVGVDAADLPAAIVRVMLASYRLAHLEER